MLLVATCFALTLCLFIVAQKSIVTEPVTFSVLTPTLVPCMPKFECSIVTSPHGHVQLHYAVSTAFTPKIPYHELTLPNGKQLIRTVVQSWSYDDQFAILVTCPYDPINTCSYAIWDMVRFEEIKGIGGCCNAQWVPNEHAIAYVAVRFEPPSTVWHVEIYYLAITNIDTRQVTVPEECPDWYKPSMYTRSPAQCLGRPGFEPLPASTPFPTRRPYP
jgi:hypothetical protein